MGGDNTARPPEPPDRQIALALSAGHVDLYLTSPSFHDSIDTLAAMLPAMVDGLAAQAKEQDENAVALRDAIESRPRLIPLDGLQ